MSLTSRSVSIIVPCRNEAGHLGPFLDSLLAQDCVDLDWEAIIVDGMSEDGTQAILSAYCGREPRIRVMENARGIVSTGLNAAIAAARGEVILRMDAHSEYSPDYVRECVATLSRSGAANVGGAARTKASGFVQRAIAAAYHSRWSTGGARFHDEAYEGPVDTVTYGCWRKETLLSIGLFDETLVRNQDDELNFRLIRAGQIVWQSPRIRSWYRPRKSFSALFWQYFQYGFWKVAVIRKHRLPASLRHIVPGLFVLANFALPLSIALAGALKATSFAGWLSLCWFIETGAYLLLLISASAFAAAECGWDLVLPLPLVFAVYHLSYGMGFLAGLIHFLTPRSARPCPGKVFTEVTR